MSMHAKTDSEVTSLAPSSPNRHVYYVQSPSRDSHDGKTTNSFHSTPIISPAASPGRHSRESSSTRFSGSLKPSSGGSRKGLVPKVSRGKGFDSIEEEGLLDDDVAGRGIHKRWYLPIFVLAFIVLFSFFALVLWGASRNQKPVVTMRSISFNEFIIQAGNDNSGVATEMVTMNSTVKLTYRNTGTFFGIHVTSSPISLAFFDLALATGSIKKFYQSRKSQRLVTVTLLGTRTPLYGGGSDLGSVKGVPILPVPLDLNFTIKSKAYVLGKLVKPKFNERIYCSVVMDPKKMNKALSLKKNCTVV